MSSTRIQSVNQLTDYVHQLCYTHPDEWDKKELLSRIHKNLVSTTRDPMTLVHDEVYVCYFLLASLLTGDKVSKHRIISTIDGIADRYR
jgi:hypothetical protein